MRERRRKTAMATASLAALLIAAAAGAASVHAETLGDAIALAYQSNPTLQSQRSQLRVLDESYVQARAGLRPQAAAQVQANFNNGPATQQTGVTTDTAALTLSQPLYTGGLVSNEVRAALADIQSGREKLRQVEASVLQSVIQAYVDVRRDQQALTISRRNVAVLRRQLGETQAQFKVGQITRTDVAQGEARLAQADAQLGTATAQLALSRANYVQVVGQSPGDLAPEPPLPGVPATVDEAFAAADKTNGGVTSADFAEQAAAARVAAAKSAYRPTVSLNASVGYEGSVGSAPLLGLRAGQYYNAITAGATLTQPLFAGGLNASRVRAALENDNGQRIAVETARRQAVQSVSQAWNQILAARIGVEANERQVAADKIAFEGARQELKIGIRTTLDVLNAEQELQNAQLALVNAKHDLYVANAALLSAMGRLEIQYLAPDAARYNPEAQFKKVRRKGALPWDGVVAGLDALGAPSVRKAPAPGPQVTAAPLPPPPPAEAGSEVMN